MGRAYVIGNHKTVAIYFLSSKIQFPNMYSSSVDFFSEKEKMPKVAKYGKENKYAFSVVKLVSLL